ncbi:MAG TPA: CBS domain-containing protein [Saprospiraceae bacterium]|nr:CBS domain-containing protein [Saprospiraceae bacterium]
MNANKAVSEIMTRKLTTVGPDTSISRIHDLFDRHLFHHLPVVEQGRLTGIISRVDYLTIRHMLSINWDGKTAVQDWFAGMCARDIMTRDPVCIESDDTIGLAADIFKTNHFHALPVVDDGELVGLITSHDLLSYAYKNILEEENTIIFTPQNPIVE